ncbi:MAG: ribosome assembly cofactor RimP [Bacteroidales bacterium]
MVDVNKIEEALEEILDKNQYFVVEVSIKNDKIKVVVDGYENFRIDDCVAITRQLKNKFAGALDDFTVEVTSPGLTAPFKVKEQYEKNIGKEVEVLLIDGDKVKGVLKKYSPGELQIEQKETIKEKGKKRKTIITEKRINTKEIKKTKLVITF